MGLVLAVVPVVAVVAGLASSGRRKSSGLETALSIAGAFGLLLASATQDYPEVFIASLVASLSSYAVIFLRGEWLDDRKIEINRGAHLGEVREEVVGTCD